MDVLNVEAKPPDDHDVSGAKRHIDHFEEECISSVPRDGIGGIVVLFELVDVSCLCDVTSIDETPFIDQVFVDVSL